MELTTINYTGKHTLNAIKTKFAVQSQPKDGDFCCNNHSDSGNGNLHHRLHIKNTTTNNHHHAPPPATTTTTAATGRIREREGRIRPGEEGGGEGHPPGKKKGEGRGAGGGEEWGGRGSARSSAAATNPDALLR